MFKFSKTPLDFFGLIKNSFAAYSTVVRTSWQLILLSAVLSLISTAAMKLNFYVGCAISVLVMLAIIFLYAVVVHMSYSALSVGESSRKNSMAIAKKRYLPLLGGYVVMLGIIVLLAAVSGGIYLLSGLFNILPLTLILTAIPVLFSIFVIYVVIFALPLIILEPEKVFKSYENSVNLVWGNWWQTFGVLLALHILVICIALFGVAFIPSRDVISLGIWNFIFQIVLYPLIIATVLTLLHDLQLRYRNK
jgi:hypothetical protein